MMLSSLPASSGKASTLLKERPGTVKTIAVFLGAAKKAAETQFADARTKLTKLTKGKAGKSDAMVRDPHTAPLPDNPPPAATASAGPAAKPAVLPRPGADLADRVVPAARRLYTRRRAAWPGRCPARPTSTTR